MPHQNVQPVARLPVCPRCHQPVATERVVCRWCSATHHPECWVVGRGCGHYACAGNPEVLPPFARPRPVRLPTPAPAPVGACLLGAAACVVFGLIVWSSRDLSQEGPIAAARTERSRPVAAPFSAGPASLFVHDLSIDLEPGRATLSWQGFKPYSPTFRFGRELADQPVPVARAGEGYRVELTGLIPGATYSYSIGGWQGATSETSRFMALPPDTPVPYGLRTRLPALAADMKVLETNFGERRGARMLWTRDGPLAMGGATGEGRAVLQDGSHLHSLDLDQGDCLWTHPARGAPGLARPLPLGDRVVAADQAGLFALDLASGQPRWHDPIAPVRILESFGNEIYAVSADKKVTLYRILAEDGRIVAVAGLTGLPRLVALEQDHALLYFDRTSRETEATLAGSWAGEGSGAEIVEASLMVLGRLRGDRRWDRILTGTQRLPALPVVLRGCVLVPFADRIVGLSLKEGRELSSRRVPAPPTCLLPLGDGTLLAMLGGAEPVAMHLGADLTLRSSWRLVEPVERGVVAGRLAALAGADGLTFLDLASGQRWGVSGVPRALDLHLAEAGHLLVFSRGEQNLGQKPADHVLALGVR
ncbi:MAG: PQQ-binding-like beta-propeller repeat protein [Candidatus Riflebacteria bacterium]|nr:PQQ-binding-like beta-propeller repeat protein [Candidatus Riflebacteria bacterium]